MPHPTTNSAQLLQLIHQNRWSMPQAANWAHRSSLKSGTFTSVAPLFSWAPPRRAAVNAAPDPWGTAVVAHQPGAAVPFTARDIQWDRTMSPYATSAGEGMNPGLTRSQLSVAG